MKSSFLKKYDSVEWALSAVAAVLCLVVFILFFADGVTDDGGDGQPVYLIAIDLQVSGLHFNALAFFAYALALICAAMALVPFRKEWVNAIFAVVLLLCAVAQFNMCSIYLLKYTKEIKQMYLAAGVKTSVSAYISAISCILAAILFIAKWLYPLCKRRAGGVV